VRLVYLSIDFIHTTYASNDLIVVSPRARVDLSGKKFSFTGVAELSKVL
jgi:hypothetical protein